MPQTAERLCRSAPAQAESGDVEEVLSESGKLHRALWDQATQAAAKDPHSIVTGLFIQSLNEVIDLHSKRVLLALRNRIPEIVWLALYFITVLSMQASGLPGRARPLAQVARGAFADAHVFRRDPADRRSRPPEGRAGAAVSQRSMLDLRESIQDVDSVDDAVR